MSTPGRSILLVEDEAAVRSVATRVLTGAGHRVVSAENGAEALRLFDDAADPPDLLLTDIVMPGINGWELAQALRTRRPELKILFVSGYTQEVVLAPEQMADGIQFLPKPFTPDALRAAVARAFQA